VLNRGGLGHSAIVGAITTGMEFYAGIMTECLKNMTMVRGSYNTPRIVSGLFFIQILPMIAEGLMIQVKIFCSFALNSA